ncbi:MAG TPA: hypothetical protein VM925_32020, partial [Labilithrix sp.]|nr:hypothetical protein [Labilithrix sp.]
MRRALPSRTAVLDAFSGDERPFHLSELAEKLGVEEGSYPGLLRLLDDLVFDGVLSARGEKFKLEKKTGWRSSERAPKAAPAERPASASASSAERPAERKGLPAKTRPEKAATGASAPRHEAHDRKQDRDGRAPKTTGRPARTTTSDVPERTSTRAGRRGHDRREGILTVNPRGFGFVASPTASGDDVFVNADSLGGAMQGDHVIVEIVARGARGAEGLIVEITKRGTTRVSGILRRKGKNAWIELDDPRIRGPVVLTRDIDRAGPEGNSGQEGQVVVAEITRFPEEPGENPEGKLIAVLGQPGELAVEINKILLIEKIEEVHSPPAIEEAEAYGLEVSAELLEGREDLTHIPLPTIDPEDA